MVGPLQDAQPQETIKASGTMPRKTIVRHGEVHGGQTRKERNDTDVTDTRQRTWVAVSHTWPLTQQGQLTQ